jgi:hypothetical protein
MVYFEFVRGICMKYALCRFVCLLAMDTNMTCNPPALDCFTLLSYVEVSTCFKYLKCVVINIHDVHFYAFEQNPYRLYICTCRNEVICLLHEKDLLITKIWDISMCNKLKKIDDACINTVNTRRMPINQLSLTLKYENEEDEYTMQRTREISK